jgi:hypothetical protein
VAGEGGHGLKIGVADHYSESNEAACRGSPFLIGEIPSCSSGLSDRRPKMFARIASLAMSHAAVVGVFAEIPIVSNYAFWVLVGAYFLWFTSAKPAKGSVSFLMVLSIVLLLAAILAVFVEIPIVSNYAFWVMAGNYIVSAAGFVIIKKK